MSIVCRHQEQSDECEVEPTRRHSLSCYVSSTALLAPFALHNSDTLCDRLSFYHYS